jgi:hypothetical protein
MEFTAVIVKNTLDLIDVVPTEYLNHLIQDTEGYEVVSLLLDPEIVVTPLLKCIQTQQSTKRP